MSSKTYLIHYDSAKSMPEHGLIILYSTILQITCKYLQFRVATLTGCRIRCEFQFANQVTKAFSTLIWKFQKEKA